MKTFLSFHESALPFCGVNVSQNEVVHSQICIAVDRRSDLCSLPLDDILTHKGSTSQKPCRNDDKPIFTTKNTPEFHFVSFGKHVTLNTLVDCT